MTHEQEREWLESRGLSVAYDWKDAAEFEARVAVLLTDHNETYIPPCYIVCYHKRNCRECRLMYARIAVEDEMEKVE